MNGDYQHLEERIKAWVRAHRWQAAFAYGAPVALLSIMFVLSVRDARLRTALAVGGAIVTAAIFTFWAWLGPRLASRPPAPYDRRRRLLAFVLVMAACFGTGLAIGLAYFLLSG